MCIPETCWPSRQHKLLLCYWKVSPCTIHVDVDTTTWTIWSCSCLSSLQILSDVLELNIDQVTFWTDSMIVLGYIKNVSRRFKTFIGNRLGIIHGAISPNQWHYVESSLNPADIASRVMNTCDKESLHIWLNGPKSLWHDSEHWPQQQHDGSSWK